MNNFDPDEIKAIATSVIGPQPETDAEGTVRWFWRGQRHRDDGPAVECVDGFKAWCRNGQFHRDDGPAVEWSDGSKEWWRNGQRHRDDGPAVEYVDGYKAWWRNGVPVEPFTESMDPDELEALATSVLGPQPETDEKGTVRWFWRGQRHREDGPATEWSDGSKEWLRNGQRHREDGPACEWANGDKEWYRNGQLHREDGPAVEYANGNKWWYRNGLLHREDGPACEWADGSKWWYRNGVQVEPFTESMDPDEIEALATSVMGPQPETDKAGTVRWYWRGLLHRDDGPAIEWASGDKWWFKDGLCHRDGGPAYEGADGSKSWYRNGQRHREDGPAVEFADGTKEWYRRGLLHREDGPAIEYASGDKSWWRNGVLVKPFTESMDPDELEALATSVLGPQPETDEDGTVRWYWRGQLHRDGGPAIEYTSGSKVWYRNGQRHREDGPAVEYADGYKAWFRDGLLHRDDGPAIEYASGTKEWWRNGVRVEPFTESIDFDTEAVEKLIDYRGESQLFGWFNPPEWSMDSHIFAIRILNEDMDPDELEALVTSVLGPQPVTDKFGTVSWFWRGQLHRDDGPAVEYAHGTKEWWRNGRLHRDDGPAVEWVSGYKAWYRNGVQVKPFTESMDPDELEAIATSVMGPQPETDDEGTVHWYWRGQRHREDGPATEWSDGSKEWLRNGQRHREDGPACEWANGSKSWYRNGQRHRDDGPAVERANGYKEWWRNGRLHREDGPAIEWANRGKAWWVNGVRVEPFTESMDPDELEALATSVMGPQPETDEDGTVRWYWKGRLHREDGPAIEWANGDKSWWRNGVLVKPFTESLDPEELEAIATSVMGPQPETDEEGNVHWYWKGRLHRDDGPAVEWASGDKWWCRNGQLHRDDGPAIEWADGSKMWWRNGQRHRDDGPAVEYADGYKAWYRNGVRVEPFTESILMG